MEELVVPTQFWAEVKDASEEKLRYFELAVAQHVQSGGTLQDVEEMSRALGWSPEFGVWIGRTVLSSGKALTLSLLRNPYEERFEQRRLGYEKWRREKTVKLVVGGVLLIPSQLFLLLAITNAIPIGPAIVRMVNQAAVGAVLMSIAGASLVLSAKGRPLYWIPIGLLTFLLPDSYPASVSPPDDGHPLNKTNHLSNW